MQKALITGASSGIGAAFAKELAKRRTDLVLVARSEEKLREVADRLQEQFKIQVEVLAIDLQSLGAAKAVFEFITAKGWEIDLLINNAGFGDYGSFTQSDRQKLLDMIQLNAVALVDLTYQFLPGMQQRRYGNIINVGSLASFQALPYMAVYSASKAFVLNFSEALWAENEALGIRVQALCPGPTATGFYEVAGLPRSMKSALTPANPEKVVFTSLQALESNKPVVVSGGLGNQIIANIGRFLPRAAILRGLEPRFRPKA